MEIPKLKPCPFCGVVPDLMEAAPINRNDYFVICSHRLCAIQPRYPQGHGYLPMPVVINAWNYRDGELP